MPQPSMDLGIPKKEKALDFSLKMKKSDKSCYIYEKTCQFDMSVRFILADSNTSESFR